VHCPAERYTFISSMQCAMSDLSAFEVHRRIRWPFQQYVAMFLWQDSKDTSAYSCSNFILYLARWQTSPRINLTALRIQYEFIANAIRYEKSAREYTEWDIKNRPFRWRCLYCTCTCLSVETISMLIVVSFCTEWNKNLINVLKFYTKILRYDRRTPEAFWHNGKIH